MILLELAEWLPLYDQICRDFRFDKEKDAKSATLLASMIGSKGTSAVQELRKGFPESVLICGGSTTLSEEISSSNVEGFVVAADSATSALLEASVSIDMIVTDLDGIVEDQFESNSKGAVIFIHAHGDNQPAVRNWTPKFVGRVVGTCQCPPPPGLFNFGGFTDGDRAACICAAMGARTIRLLGFDFENPSEKAGKKRETKKRKLVWARRIMDKLALDGVRFVYASEQ